MRTLFKGASDKRRLTQYVTNTVPTDSFKGTTEQFVLHFNEQFRQLDEISDDSEKLPQEHQGREDSPKMSPTLF